jgi:hypothetical protein
MVYSHHPKSYRHFRPVPRAPVADVGWRTSCATDLHPTIIAGVICKKKKNGKLVMKIFENLAIFNEH